MILDINETERKELDKLFSLLVGGIQLYIQGWQPNQDIIQEIRKKMFIAYTEEQEKTNDKP